MIGLYRSIVVLLIAAFAVPIFAQDEAPNVLLLPSNDAQFLPGSIFDVRVEVHAEELPDDFAVTVNGEDATAFFGVEPEAESWTFEAYFTTEFDEPQPSNSWIWRDVVAPAPGEYAVDVTAGGETHSYVWTVREPGEEQVAQNVILFIADGGSSAVYTTTRLVSRGMTEGRYNDHLSFDAFEEIGLISTSGLDSIITDSANSASAYNTGHKSAVNATGVYPDTSEDPFDDPKVETFAQLIKRVLNMSVGLVTTAEYVDATPAAVWAHSRARTNGTRAAYALEFLDIQPEVVLGGGGRYMIPQTVDGSRRSDDEDVFTMYEDAGYTIVTTGEELDEAIANGVDKLAGIFHPGNMDVWLDRNVYTDNVTEFPDQPGLVEMTLAALPILATNENGFYLQVEAASVDKQLHPMDFERGIADAIEFDRAVAETMAWLEENGLLEDTLVIVTSDHAHSFDVFGTVDTEVFNAAETDFEKTEAIQVYQDAGYPDYADADGDYYPDNWDVQTTLAWGKADNPPFTEDYQVSEVPRVPTLVEEDGTLVDNPDDDPNGIALGGNLPPFSNSSVHTLQDVPVYAQGPGSAALGGVIDNTEVFFAMANALGLNPAGE